MASLCCLWNENFFSSECWFFRRFSFSVPASKRTSRILQSGSITFLNILTFCEFLLQHLRGHFVVYSCIISSVLLHVYCLYKGVALLIRYGLGFYFFVIGCFHRFISFVRASIYQMRKSGVGIYRDDQWKRG